MNGHTDAQTHEHTDSQHCLSSGSCQSPPQKIFIQPVNSNEHHRPGGEEDKGVLCVASELAEDLLT